MSGIAAAIRFDGGPAPVDDLRRMIAASPHRAPDGVGTWTGDGAVLAKLHRLVLPGQRTSDQPACERKGPHVVVFDGRLDAADDADGAITVLDAIARRGADGVSTIEGEFAFAAWNRRTRTLVAARDRIGLRPLYWALDGGRLLVASDIAQVLAAMSNTPEPDAQSVSDLLAFAPASGAQTLFSGVQRVPPGHMLVADAAGTRLREYWRAEPTPIGAPRSDDDYTDECRELLRDAVRRRLRAATPVVTFFSGGVDSSSVLATALDICRESGLEPPQPVSMVFEQEESDERAFRRAFSARHGIAEIEVQPGTIDPIEYGAQAARRRLPPDLPADFIGRPLLWRARDMGARVALTGAGGDLLFAGSPLQYADLIRRGRLIAAATRYFQDRRMEESGWTPTGLLTAGVWPLLPQAVRTAVRVPLRRVLGMEDGPEWLRLPRPGREAVPDPPRGVSHASWDICWGLRSGWTSALLESNERGMSESGIEARHPLYDVALIRFVLSLPERQRRRDGMIKYILRRAANLPPAIETRVTKADFGYVILDAFEALGGRAFFERLRIAELGWVDPGAACRGYDLVRARTDWRDQHTGALLPRLWILAAVELWYRAVFGVPQGAGLT